MEKYLQDILKELKTLNTKVDILEQGQQDLKSDVQTLKGDVQTLTTGLQEANTKLDVLYAQVARNTEQEVQLDNVLTRVELLENDNKIIKKIVANL